MCSAGLLWIFLQQLCCAVLCCAVLCRGGVLQPGGSDGVSGSSFAGALTPIQSVPIGQIPHAFVIPFEELTLQEMIGSGAEGKVSVIMLGPAACSSQQKSPCHVKPVRPDLAPLYRPYISR